MNAPVSVLRPWNADGAGGALAFWRQAARLVLLSRALDALEEELCAQGQIAYQFSARGHDVAQVIIGLHLRHPRDAFAGYYRSRPALLALGVELDEIVTSTLGRAGGYSDGRDIGVVFNHPGEGGATALPMAGGVGSQFTPAMGWAQAIEDRRLRLGEREFDGAIALVSGGDGAVASNGFWAGLNLAATLALPALIVIEDNGLGISTPSTLQTPGGDISRNLRGFEGIRVLSGNGADPEATLDLVGEAFDHVRERSGPCLLRLTVPRLQGHSFQDTQAYRARDDLAQAAADDPLPRLRVCLDKAGAGPDEWVVLAREAQQAVAAAHARARLRPEAGVEGVLEDLMSGPRPQRRGGLRPDRAVPVCAPEPIVEDGPRINLAEAIRRTLGVELALNPRMLVFGQDVGAKGGVHGVTAGLQAEFGDDRVFDTALSEEGIVGRAIGMALCGLLPVPEIQFRKYAEPAAEQIADCGSLRWRTRNRFAAPMVLRMPIGFGRTGDPWHSATNEAQLVHTPGWKVVVPSNAADAAGLLRQALRGDDPVMFLEHRALLHAASARRPYPGDAHLLPFGKARLVQDGRDLTIVTWGAMLERCEQAAFASGRSVAIIDLRTLVPWDREMVMERVTATRRCLIVHEDLQTAGFGAEIAAVVSHDAFLDLDAPVMRLGMRDVPPPYMPGLLEAVLPTAGSIAAAIGQLTSF